MKGPAVQCFFRRKNRRLCPRGLLEVYRYLFTVRLSDAVLSQHRLVRP
jgi:hypothetical protein